MGFKKREKSHVFFGLRFEIITACFDLEREYLINQKTGCGKWMCTDVSIGTVTLIGCFSSSLGLPLGY